VKWLKEEALSSNSGTTRKKKGLQSSWAWMLLLQGAMDLKEGREVGENGAHRGKEVRLRSQTRVLEF
jgi:hypothetical protein